MKKIFLLYCLAISILLSVAGFLINKDQNVPFQILFLPVPLYLLFSLFSGWKQKYDEKRHYENVLLYFVIFAVLVFISLINIFYIYNS